MSDVHFVVVSQKVCVFDSVYTASFELHLEFVILFMCSAVEDPHSDPDVCNCLLILRTELYLLCSFVVIVLCSFAICVLFYFRF